MTRCLVICGCVFALAIAAPLGSDAQAAKKGKWCSAAAMNGKQTKWKCKAGLKCCYDWMGGKGACVAATDVCL
jgi:hypothetical protein